MYCHNCGSPNNDGAKFCRNCGTALTVVTAGPVERPDKGKSKGKKKSFKAVAVILVVAILASAVAVVGLTVDFKKIALNDFEYYLYLEKKNAEELLGEDFVNLLAKYPSFSAETTMTSACSGSALNYDYLEEVRRFSGSELKIKTDYNGSDILNIDGDYFYSDGDLVLDVIATVFNGDVIFTSDTLFDASYSLKKIYDSKYGLIEIKESLTNLFISVYEHFGKFEDYIEVSKVGYDGEKVEKMFMYFDNEFIAELTEYVFEYSSKDEVIFYFIEKIWAMSNADLYEELEEDGFDNFKEAWEYLIDNGNYNWWVEDKVEIEYEVVYDKEGNILSREMIFAEVADDNEYKFKNSVSRPKSGDVTSTLRVDGQTVLELSNYDGDFFAEFKVDDDIEYNLSCEASYDSFKINFSEEDDKHYCGSVSGQSIYERLKMDLEFNTVFSTYNFTPDNDIIDNAKALEYNEAVEISENIENRVAAKFE